VRPENPTILDFLTLQFEKGQLVRSKTSGLEMWIVDLYEPGVYAVEYASHLWRCGDLDELIIHDGFDLEAV